MKNLKQKNLAMDKFLDLEEDKDKKIITTKDGLIERFDVTYVTKNGKQLLKEIYR